MQYVWHLCNNYIQIAYVEKSWGGWAGFSVNAYDENVFYYKIIL